MAAELDHLEETQYGAVAFVELWSTSQIKMPASTLWTNPDAHPVPLLHGWDDTSFSVRPGDTQSHFWPKGFPIKWKQK